MSPIVLGTALVFGLVARRIGLPPLVGFLLAGFALNAAGFETSEALAAVADMGITLLLFGIGLKLDVKRLLRPEIWAVASAHMLAIVLGIGIFLYLVALAGVSLFAGLEMPVALLLAFALSFSSTVFAVKVLEEKGEEAALHGVVAIGILIVQDLLAVVFLAVSAGKVPTPLGVGIVVALIALKRVFVRVMQRCGHGELLVLFGVVVAIGGAQAFDQVGIKGDLGALFLGVLLASGSNAKELSKSLLGFKDLFLIGFFLTIGLSGLPSPELLGIALALTLLVPFKVVLFFALMTRFRLRARTSVMASFSLANYSEFGLIIGGVAVANGWLDNDWLLVLALAMSLSYVAASPLNFYAGEIFERFSDALRRHEGKDFVPEESTASPGDVVAVVLGMGRLGVGAYAALCARYADRVVGVDSCPETVQELEGRGLNVVQGDAADAGFWRGVDEEGAVKLVLLTTPKHDTNLRAARQIAGMRHKDLLVGAATRYEDEADELRRAGVHEVFDWFEEVGEGFAEHMLTRQAEHGETT